MIKQYECMLKISFTYFVRKIKLSILIRLNLLSLQLKTYTGLIKRKLYIPFAETFYRVDQ